MATAPKMVRKVDVPHLMATWQERLDDAALVAEIVRKAMAEQPSQQRTACIRGHEYTKETSYTNSWGSRVCRICTKILNQRRNQRRKRQRQRGKFTAASE